MYYVSCLSPSSHGWIVFYTFCCLIHAKTQFWNVKDNLELFSEIDPYSLNILHQTWKLSFLMRRKCFPAISRSSRKIHFESDEDFWRNFEPRTETTVVMTGKGSWGEKGKYEMRWGKKSPEYIREHFIVKKIGEIVCSFCTAFDIFSVTFPHFIALSANFTIRNTAAKLD